MPYTPHNITSPYRSYVPLQTVAFALRSRGMPKKAYHGEHRSDNRMNKNKTPLNRGTAA